MGGADFLAGVENRRNFFSSDCTKLAWISFFISVSLKRVVRAFPLTHPTPLPLPFFFLLSCGLFRFHPAHVAHL